MGLGNRETPNCCCHSISQVSSQVKDREVSKNKSAQSLTGKGGMGNVFYLYLFLHCFVSLGTFPCNFLWVSCSVTLHDLSDAMLQDVVAR